MNHATFSDLLRRWNSAGELATGLARHGCTASETLIRRWWNEEMLPDRAWRAFVALAQESGHKDITLELLATIAETSRQDRFAALTKRAQAAGSQTNEAA